MACFPACGSWQVAEDKFRVSIGEFLVNEMFTSSADFVVRCNCNRGGGGQVQGRPGISGDLLVEAFFVAFASAMAKIASSEACPSGDDRVESA